MTEDPRGTHSQPTRAHTPAPAPASHPCATVQVRAALRIAALCTMALITALSALDTSTQLLIYGLLTVHVGALVFWAYMCSRPQVRHADKLE